MRSRLPAVISAISLVFSNVSADPGTSDAARRVRTYMYRPEVFADRAIGIGLPSNPSILQGYFWYIRLEQSVRTALGMESLSRFLQANRIPGIDFTNDHTLTTSDIERLFDVSVWKPSGTYKFRFLKLDGTLVGDESLPTIGRLFDLEVLGLGDQVSDRGIPWLKNLIHLKVLELSSPRITDAGMAVVSRLKELQRLSLKGTGVSDEGLEAILHLPLKHLELGAAVTDRGLAKASHIPSLLQLDVSQSAVTGAGLAELSSLTGLHTLFLGHSIADEDITALPRLKNLKRLDMTKARLTDAAAETLSGMPSLEELALTSTAIGNATLQKLSRLPHLRYLEISGTHVTPEVFAKLDGFSALQVISFSTDHRLTRSDILPLARLPMLHSILINGVVLGPDAVGALRQGVHSWIPSFVSEAQAASGEDANVDQALEVASAIPQEPPTKRFDSEPGLERIHQAESSLEDVSGTPSAPKIQVFEENEKNFLGEITVGVAVSRVKRGG